MPLLTSRIAAALLISGSLTAANAAESLSWDCTQTDDRAHHARCVVRPGEPREAAAPSGALAPAVLPAPRPGMPDMRPVAQRGADAEIDSEPWLVPMHAAPADPKFALALLESVLCGTHPACRVSYHPLGARIASR